MNITQQTQVTFMSNTELKDRTIKKVKEDGITLKALLTMAMRAYLNNDLKVSLQSSNDYYDEIFADREIIKKANELGSLLDKTKI
ncbi:MAG: hypothetical protein COU31_04030 [Candidatus Magasanikbacteria bacterium CG10_big_fil_rev_8_21_14_0_10_40_10]|uniref:Uncharacterized protein n=1 Tax=Candidatus Magasanikbacteria bacterium CG10_big_fil_rev_8_21_14_0_10_40_10 TaxID=1974648 RepID=A0A2M6W379_9BACT|nr:MAG: hypothetical protein COU31_04030 [Candidatus Magasanikbacteria bacterium CG10_big_fil_rev_8_21_14_0_10_40_10]